MSGNILNNTMASILGGGIPGSQSKKIYDKNSESNYNRLFLRQSFGNSHLSDFIGSPLNIVRNRQSKTTPFRAIMAAGDVNGTVNSAPSSKLPQTNQISSSSTQSVRAGRRGINNNGNSYYSGNPKFVYDGSDYVKYKKLRALLSSYDKK